MLSPRLPRGAPKRGLEQASDNGDWNGSHTEGTRDPSVCRSDPSRVDKTRSHLRSVRGQMCSVVALRWAP